MGQFEDSERNAEKWVLPTHNDTAGAAKTDLFKQRVELAVTAVDDPCTDIMCDLHFVYLSRE